jgi:hypothetical protein
MQAGSGRAGIVACAGLYRPVGLDRQDRQILEQHALGLLQQLGALPEIISSANVYGSL